MDLERTVAELVTPLIRYAAGLVGDPDLGADVAQDALAALVGRWRAHGPPNSPAAFAFTVARRRGHRARWRRRLLLPLGQLTNGHSPSPGPLEAAEQRERFEAVRHALDGLSAKDREALLLAAVAEVDSATGAAIVGLTPSGFRMRVQRARRRLQERLGNRGEAR